MGTVALQEHAEDDLQVDGLSDTDTDDYDVLDEPVPAKDSAQIAKNIKDILRQKNLTLPIRNPSDSAILGPKSPQFSLSPEPKSPLFKPLGSNPEASVLLLEPSKTKSSSSASAPPSSIPGNYFRSFIKLILLIISIISDVQYSLASISIFRNISVSL